MIKPPENSKIRIETENRFEKIILPPPEGLEHGYTKWMGGPSSLLSAFLFAVIFAHVFFGDPGLVPKDLFPRIALTAALAAGFLITIFSALFFVKMWRRPLPETLTIAGRKLIYDSGTPTMQLAVYPGFRNNRHPYGYWIRASKIFFEKRLQTTFTSADLASLARKNTIFCGRLLTLRQGSKEVELGRNLGEAERDWLHRTIATHYGLQYKPSAPIAEAARPLGVTGICLCIWLCALLTAATFLGAFTWLPVQPRHVPQAMDILLWGVFYALISVSTLALWQMKKWGLVVTFILGIGGVALAISSFGLLNPFQFSAAVMPFALILFMGLPILDLWRERKFN